jgi:hypothetical protein
MVIRHPSFAWRGADLQDGGRGLVAEILAFLISQPKLRPLLDRPNLRNSPSLDDQSREATLALNHQPADDLFRIDLDGAAFRCLLPAWYNRPDILRVRLEI